MTFDCVVISIHKVLGTISLKQLRKM